MFIRANETGKLRVTYWREDGSSATFIGGKRTWRNNNPGNIMAGKFANTHGAIGKAGGFATFPSPEIGHQALIDLLNTQTYQRLSIEELVKRYAPPKENDTKRYQAMVRRWTGLDLKRKLHNLSAKELLSLVSAIERMEGRGEGEIIEAPAPQAKKKISAVRKDAKGTIVGYYVGGLGWLAQGPAIDLASKGRIDAVVAVSRAGNPYLRTRPDQKAENNLKAMG